MPDETLTPSPSPSRRGESEAVYRDAASKVMVRIARLLRQRETSTEKIMWEALRSRRLNSLKFRRQHPIANTAFVADFFCYEASLVVEIDGGVHVATKEDDELRQAIIENLGYRVIRFPNHRIRSNMQDVLETIVKVAAERTKCE